MIFIKVINFYSLRRFITTHTQPQSKPPTITYPFPDGKPRADSTIQYKCITKIKDGMEAFLKDESKRFVAGELHWYPVEGNNKICQAPEAEISASTGREIRSKTAGIRHRSRGNIARGKH